MECDSIHTRGNILCEGLYSRCIVLSRAGEPFSRVVFNDDSVAVMAVW
jgi:hypothetical protein